MQAHTSSCSIRRYKSWHFGYLPPISNINLGKTDKNHENRLGKTYSCCGGGIRTNKSLQTLQRFGYLEVLLQLCRRK
jgi:hypothetical protein